MSVNSISFDFYHKQFDTIRHSKNQELLRMSRKYLENSKNADE